MTTEPILSQAYGYGFTLGIGAAFALIIAIITRVLSKYLGQVQNSERFSTASRSVGSGLISSSTVSAWTWPATLLASGTWSYSHGVMGSFMYGIGGVIQITLFLALAIQLKLRAPSAHTLSECFHIRYGKAGHWMFLSFCVATNILISSLLLLGGSQAFAAITGMHTVAASFLLPLGVMVYTALGGLKATFISDWIHTVIIYTIIIVAVYRTYCTSELIGSPGKMYDLLQEVQETFPSATGQSYVSFRDSDMLMLTWTVALGGMSSVFGDVGYSQRAIASSSTAVFKGYLTGAICWFIIPACLGASAGLSCRALLNNPASITYPNALSAEEVDSALPVIYGLAAIFGKSGAAAGLVMIFMSVTSASSAELIAFSSIVTYDVYRIYRNPDADGKQLVKVAHLAVLGFGLFMGVIATVFNYIGVSAGWLLSFTGIIVSPVVSSCTFTMFWPKLSKTALLIGAPLGTVSAIICWVAGAYVYGDHVVDKVTLMLSEATLIGNAVALFSPIIYFVILSYLKPDEPFDLNKFNEITLADDLDEEEAKALIVTDQEKKLLKRQTWWSVYLNIFVVIGCYLILPLGLFGSNHDLSRNSFIGLIIVLMIWLVVAAVYIIFFPLWQGRYTILFLFKILLGKKEATNASFDSSQGESDGPDVSEVIVHNDEKGSKRNS